MQKNISDLASSVANSLSNLASSFGPILESKDKENQKLKRLLRQRSNIKSDNDIIMAEIRGGGGGSNQPYKRQKTEVQQ